MTISSLIALFTAMVVLAAIPSISVLTVVTRAIASGFIHGLVTALGIVAGDIIFILIAIYGLSVVAETANEWYILLKYLGSAYLIVLGISLCRSRPVEREIRGARKSSWLSSFLSGLLITLGDQKAVLFYMGFLPAFVDLSMLSLIDAGLIVVTAVLAVGSVKIGYAYMANSAKSFFQNAKATKVINMFAGSVMILTGLYLAIKH
ncbi:LysE family translocator [cf. Phormidesmis sp. LEGE 11477]|uniref:LysE family translocator n=1 Tax=cf. Phormidesmis sp. LEGE 11477 TaxID=1828680 RepID=UPI00188071D4|nr:LysE family translocator [cf. Phormidesmis sp. LEGE 11477]MBE9063793.1 LysE family translocator [cf. Phormidesmis sp. LEGE 11477]